MLQEARFDDLLVAAPAPAAPSLAALLDQRRPSAIIIYGPDQIIFGEGDATGTIYAVEFGSVRLTRLAPDGQRQVIGFVMAGESFGFSETDQHDFYAESAEPTGLRQLRSFDKGNRTTASAARSQSARERVAAFLADFHERQGRDGLVTLPAQRVDMADHLDLTVAVINAVLGQLKAEGRIRLVNTRQVQMLEGSMLAH